MKRVLGLYTWETTPGHVRLYDLEELESYGPVRGLNISGAVPRLLDSLVALAFWTVIALIPYHPK